MPGGKAFAIQPQQQQQAWEQQDSLQQQQQQAGADHGLTRAEHDDILTGVAKALVENLKQHAEKSSELMDDKNALTAEVVATFAWKKSDSAAGGGSFVQTSRGEPHVKSDRTPSKPQDVKFTLKALNDIFKNRADMSKEQHVLAVTVTEYDNPTPFPLALHLDKIQDQSIHRSFTEDGTGAAFIMLPRSKSEMRRELYRMTNVNEDTLKHHGNASLQEELSQLIPLGTTGKVLVSPDIRLGRIIAANWPQIGTEPLKFVADDLPFFAVHENIVKHVIDNYNKDVLQTLAKTKFTEHVIRLTRADRTSAEAASREFGDASDVANVSKVAIEAAHQNKQAVHVKIEYKLIDPSKLVQSKASPSDAGASDK